MATRQLRVSLGATPVGELLKLADGRVLFTFDPEYVERADRPVLSLSYFDGDGGLEGGQMLVGSGQVPPFFANLLPEGHLRSYIAARADVPATREFKMLELLGGDLPGAVRVHPADEDAEPATLEPPVSSDGPPLRFSLAGVQLKFSALAEAGGGLTVPARGMGGDWIVKCPSMHYPGVTENEYSSMRLAAAVGIDVPEVRLIDMERIAGLPPDLLPSGMPSEPALAVRRFDRVAEGRVHMEDFGQVLERRPEDKYGPRGYAHIALPLGAYCDARSLAQFAARLMFSALVGNGDLHAKNWSLLYRDGRTPELSPAYDLLCTTAYIPGDTPALAIGSARRWESLGPDDFAELADSAHVARAVFVRAAQETCERFRDSWRDIAQDLPLRDDIRAAIERQLETVPAARGIGRVQRTRARRRPRPARASETDRTSNS